VGAALPLLTGIVVWIVLRLQGKPVLDPPTLFHSWLLWLLMLIAMGVAALPAAFLVRYVTKEHDAPWVGAAAWGILIGLATTIAIVFGSLWRDAESAIDVVMMAPHILAVIQTIGAVIGGFAGMMAGRALHAAHGGRRSP
jgi:hypothetical protein